MFYKMQIEYFTFLFDDAFCLQYANYINVHHFKGGEKTIYNTVNREYHNIYGPAVQSYWQNNSLQNTFYYIRGDLDRDYYPALIYTTPNGNTLQIGHYKNNRLHNNYGPAAVSYHADGSIFQVMYFVDGLFQTFTKIE